MLLVDCPGHGGPTLIWTSGIKQVRNTPTGIEVDYRCTCGQAGTWTPRLAAARSEERFIEEPLMETVS